MVRLPIVVVITFFSARPFRIPTTHRSFPISIHPSSTLKELAQHHTIS